MKHLWAKVGVSLFLGIVCAVGVFSAPPDQAPARGNLIGYIYDKDGTTPVPSAVLKLRNISSGSIYEAPATDKAGFFKVENLAKGIYNFGISTAAGDFNSNELVGIIENETTKLSISLSPYENEIRQSMQEIAREQSVKENEARIGRVVQ
ncbi:MAG: carboxypeptidase-like regulatory domain-containing protein, partial [Candidatus Aminicenantales bacterium]